MLALGLSVHTGWAAGIVVGGTLRAPRIEARERIELLDDARRFVFHRAAEMNFADATRSVACAKEDALMRTQVSMTAKLLRGRNVVCCGIVARKGPMPTSLERILAAHPRIHSAEGFFYRDVLRSVADALGMTTLVISPRDLEARYAPVLGVSTSEVPALLVEAGRLVGTPWAKDQRIASLAAWIALAEH